MNTARQDKANLDWLQTLRGIAALMASLLCFRWIERPIMRAAL